MKKYLPIILAVFLIAALFGGCTGTDNTGATTTPGANVTATPGNTPNVSPDTPNDSIFDTDADTTDEGIMDMEPNNTDDQGILGDMGDAAGDIADDVGDAARDIGDDLGGNNRRNANTTPTAGADHGVTSKR